MPSIPTACKGSTLIFPKNSSSLTNTNPAKNWAIIRMTMPKIGFSAEWDSCNIEEIPTMITPNKVMATPAS